MTTTTAMGSNSCYIAYDTSDTVTTLMTAITTWLTANGWNAYDTISTSRVIFNSFNDDGVTVKYLEINCSSSSITCNIYETWNATTHVGTNLSSNISNTMSHSCGSGGTGQVFLYATPRYMTIQIKYGTTYSQSWGVYEIFNDNAQDNSSVPPYVSFSTSIGTGVGVCYVAPCRTRNGLLSGSAAESSGLIWAFGQLKRTAYNSGNQYNSMFWPTAVNPWSGKALASTPSVFMDAYYGSSAYGQDFSTNVDFRGRLYGIKMISQNVGASQDIIPIKCDSNGMTDPNGTAVNHHILGFLNYRIAVPL